MDECLWTCLEADGLCDILAHLATPIVNSVSLFVMVPSSMQRSPEVGAGPREHPRLGTFPCVDGTAPPALQRSDHALPSTVFIHASAHPATLSSAHKGVHSTPTRKGAGGRPKPVRPWDPASEEPPQVFQPRSPDGDSWGRTGTCH